MEKELENKAEETMSQSEEEEFKQLSYGKHGNESQDINETPKTV